MEWEVILALVLGIPMMLFTQILLWALIMEGIHEATKGAPERRVGRGVTGATTQPLATKH